jgi:hypothetical protein
MHGWGLDIFVLISGCFSVVATFPLVYLALGSFRDGRELRRIQAEVAALMGEVRELQHEIHVDQKDAKSEIVQTKETVERVARATQRRRLPRIRLEFSRAEDLAATGTASTPSRGGQAQRFLTSDPTGT